MPGLHVPNRAAATLLRLLTDPDAGRSLSLDDWDRVIRAGRTSRLLATLRQRLDAASVLEAVPGPVRNHLDSEAAAARYRKQLVLRDLHQLESALEPVAEPVVLLKGAAYIVQSLRFADGRTVSDVDLLVPRDRLAEVEAQLREAGWIPVEVDPYDERYYREWSHEVPPMRFPGGALELDLHHGILPPISRVRVDPAPLFAESCPIPGSAFRVLAPEDQVLHACVHALVDSDLSDRLRDIVDLDSLLRELAKQPGFWERLWARSEALDLGRALWYGLRYASLLVATPVPEAAWRALGAHAPNAAVRTLIDWLVVNVTPPVPADQRTPLGLRLARAIALVRYFWIRMPLSILVRHAAVKSMRRLFPRTVSAS
jgi:hypothetical protein